MDEASKTVFVTKYAMTEGIMARELVKDHDGMAVVKWKGAPNNEAYFHGREWHHTWDAAVARAEEMRKAKIASHERSIAKLKAMTF